jgi:hypothetical protein
VVRGMNDITNGTVEKKSGDLQISQEELRERHKIDRKPRNVLYINCNGI